MANYRTPLETFCQGNGKDTITCITCGMNCPYRMNLRGAMVVMPQEFRTKVLTLSHKGYRGRHLSENQVGITNKSMMAGN